jgi:hypothetical protein
VASSELRLEVKLPAGKGNDLYPMCRIECAQEEENLVRFRQPSPRWELSFVRS